MLPVGTEFIPGSFRAVGGAGGSVLYPAALVPEEICCRGCWQ